MGSIETLLGRSGRLFADDSLSGSLPLVAEGARFELAKAFTSAVFKTDDATHGPCGIMMLTHGERRRLTLRSLSDSLSGGRP